MTDSKSVAFGRGGSSPPTGTTFYDPSRMVRVFLCLKQSERQTYAPRRWRSYKERVRPLVPLFMTLAVWLGFFYV